MTPQATGTLQFFPEFNIGPRPAPIGNDAQSSYFRTTEQNREFRRGFAEFSLPMIPNLFSATLTFRENRGTSGFPLPPDTHELSYYLSADAMIDAADYSRPTTEIGSFETDVNLEPETFTFDLTSLVRQYQGGPFGLRFKLAADPTLTAFGFAGSGFTALRIEVVTVQDAVANLVVDVALLGLPQGTATSLTAKLDSAGVALAGGNVAGACQALQAFINFTNAQSGSQPGKKIPQTTAAQLLGAATALRQALNCP